MPSDSWPATDPSGAGVGAGIIAVPYLAAQVGLVGLALILPIAWLSLAAGATAIVVALITIPMYRSALRRGAVTAPGWELGRWGSPAMLGLALLAMALMAAGSLLAI